MRRPLAIALVCAACRSPAPVERAGPRRVVVSSESGLDSADPIRVTLLAIQVHRGLAFKPRLDRQVRGLELRWTAP